MRDKDLLKRTYKNFYDFLAVVSARELEYFILDANYTSAFNYRIKKIIKEIGNKGRENIEICIMFNTSGDIAIIDADIIGKFISDCYNISLREYYKNNSVDKIIKDVRLGSEKGRKDFIHITYTILYKTLEEIYEEIKWRKEVMDKFKSNYSLNNYTKNDLPILMCVFLILEDVCRYLGIDNIFLYKNIQEIISKKSSKS